MRERTFLVTSEFFNGAAKLVYNEQEQIKLIDYSNTDMAAFQREGINRRVSGLVSHFDKEFNDKIWGYKIEEVL